MVDCRILKNGFLKKIEGVDWIDLAQNSGEFLEQLRSCSLLTNDSAPWS